MVDSSSFQALYPGQTLADLRQCQRDLLGLAESYSLSVAQLRWLLADLQRLPVPELRALMDPPPSNDTGAANQAPAQGADGPAELHGMLPDMSPKGEEHD
jgi:hypothetical protein